MIHSEAGTRDRQAILMVAAAAMVLTSGVDVAILGFFSLAPFLVRLAWAVPFVAAALLAPRLAPRSLDSFMAVLAVWSTAVWTVLSFLTGGTGSPFFYLMASLPLLFGVLAPDSVLACIVASVSAFAGNLPLLVLDDAPRSAYIVWILLSPLFGGLALIASLAYRRLRAAESAAHMEHARAVHDLAVSEKRRVQSEKLALLGTLSAGIAHEINNPIAFVKGNLDFLRSASSKIQGADTEECRAVLDDCCLGIDRIEQIITTLRAFARVDDAGVEACSVAGLVEEAERLTTAQIREVARVEIDVPNHLPPIRANRMQLVQVLVNLLVNAADAIGENGGAPGLIRVEAWESGDRVHVSLRDNGPGIPADVRGRIFEPFFTTKPIGKGTGLGLALSRDYLQRFDATIDVGDAEGGGACFVITLGVGAASSAAA